MEQATTTVLFDLDGTLLNVDMHQFVPDYLNGLAECIDPEMSSEPFVQRMIERTMQRLHVSDGSQTNEQFFLQVAQQDLGISAQQFHHGLEQFYQQRMGQLKPLIQPLPLARRILQRCVDQGLEIVIATNPVFPRPLVEARLQWGDLADFEFSWVTSFENSSYCKPNPHYFADILEKLQRTPQQCLMVGNDPEHDLSATQLGITTFLVDTWLIERDKGFVADYRGSHLDLFRFLGQLDSAV
ncbi:MAG: HAD family hydrolase [Desulfuromonas sp.]|nr:HAD family hydrolase [Desulfuromonas sp.]